MECIASHMACKLTCPPSQRQGFFSGLTDLTGDELKGTRMSTGAGSLKVRTPTPVLARTHASAVGAWQERRGCDASVPGWE